MLLIVTHICSENADMPDSELLVSLRTKIVAQYYNHKGVF